MTSTTTTVAPEDVGTLATFTSKAYIATGIIISVPGFTGEVVDVTPPSVERNEVDVSHQLTNGWKTFLPTLLKNAGELKLTTHHEGIYPYFNSAPELCVVKLPNFSKIAFYGFVKAYTTQDAKLDDKVMADLVVKVAGEIVAFTGVKDPDTGVITYTQVAMDEFQAAALLEA